MKRSEAVSIIAKAINTIRREDAINSSTNSGIVHEEEYASLLLHRLERAGMLPPKAEFKFNYASGFGSFKDYAWEPEDE